MVFFSKRGSTTVRKSFNHNQMKIEFIVIICNDVLSTKLAKLMIIILIATFEERIINNRTLSTLVILFNKYIRKYPEYYRVYEINKYFLFLYLYSFEQKYDREKVHRQQKHLMMKFDFHYLIE